MNMVDTIINCRWLIPVEPHGVVHENYAIAIDQGKITAILPKDEMAKRFLSNNIVSFSEHAVLPGFVNAHTHSPMTLFRGLADDLPLMKWLNDHIWPAETKWLSPEFIKDGTEIAIAEMISSGTTCFNEHFFFPEDIAKAAAASQLRAVIGPTIINFPTNWSQNEVDGFEKFKKLHQEIGNQELLTWSLAPHAPYTTTDAILTKIAEYSAEHNLPIHIHLHETAHEVNESLQQYGMRPLKRLAKLGLLTERLQCVHMTQIDDEDLELLKKYQATVTHCPESNLKLASGYCPVQKLLQANINVALGTDGAASNNDLDMLGEMQTAALVGKTIAEDATAVSALNVLRMATLNGAKALNLDHKIGSIEVGKEADVIAINLNSINTIPTYHPISQIVYSATNRQVTDVFVAGKQLLKDRELQTLSYESLFSQAKKWQTRITG